MTFKIDQEVRILANCKISNAKSRYGKVVEVSENTVVVRVFDDVNGATVSYQDFEVKHSDVSRDLRANFEVVTDLLWIAEQYGCAFQGQPTAPDIKTFEDAQNWLNQAIRDVHARMIDDGYPAFQYRHSGPPSKS